ncbi:uncharacterized protein LOC141908246 [Tubulanus polymorphus]|uniref:uncharacterized protein LOC141908246 n=1 Tax=Tubulanus polymorphus TaxID=672921 RepID=UPI003DA42E3C
MAGNNDVAEEEPVINMLEVLQEEKQLEEDAAAVLGGSDHKNCTYALGYVSRQALYACSTCTSSNMPPAGICLACSLECHDGHELFELYTKRNFCCDCGNGKFPKESKCKFNPDRKPLNLENEYNQNFHGLYCSCSRPYPDRDDEIEDEMIQCIMCEDWYHGRHLGNIPENADYDEMICNGCMTRYNFLWYYSVQGNDFSLIKNEESCHHKKVSDIRLAKTDYVASEEVESNEQTSEYSTKLKDFTESCVKEEPVCSSSDGAQAACLLDNLKKRKLDMASCTGATYWVDGWRKKICHCQSCMNMYAQQEISFLTDEADTVKSYEEKGLDITYPGSQYEQGMQALSGMDRVQQVEVIHGYNDMKSELKDYLSKFAENGKCNCQWKNEDSLKASNACASGNHIVSLGACRRDSANDVTGIRCSAETKLYHPRFNEISSNPPKVPFIYKCEKVSHRQETMLIKAYEEGLRHTFVDQYPDILTSTDLHLSTIKKWLKKHHTVISKKFCICNADHRIGYLAFLNEKMLELKDIPAKKKIITILWNQLPPEEICYHTLHAKSRGGSKEIQRIESSEQEILCQEKETNAKATKTIGSIDSYDENDQKVTAKKSEDHTLSFKRKMMLGVIPRYMRDLEVMADKLVESKCQVFVYVKSPDGSISICGNTSGGTVEKAKSLIEKSQQGSENDRSNVSLAKLKKGWKRKKENNDEISQKRRKYRTLRTMKSGICLNARMAGNQNEIPQQPVKAPESLLGLGLGPKSLQSSLMLDSNTNSSNGNALNNEDVSSSSSGKTSVAVSPCEKSESQTMSTALDFASTKESIDERSFQQEPGSVLGLEPNSLQSSLILDSNSFSCKGNALNNEDVSSSSSVKTNAAVSPCRKSGCLIMSTALDFVSAKDSSDENRFQHDTRRTDS